MALAFLAKKSWHTSNVKNVERVWIAEQNELKESKKVEELQKQLQEERQIQELRQLQVANGQKIKNADSSLDWMYQGPSAQSEKEKATEEYLLGKVFKPKKSESNIPAPVSIQGKIFLIFFISFHYLFDLIENGASTAWIAKVSSKNDSFTRLHEDPLLIIKQNEKKVS